MHRCTRISGAYRAMFVRRSLSPTSGPLGVPPAVWLKVGVRGVRNTGGLLQATLTLRKPPPLHLFQTHSWLVSWFSSVSFTSQILTWSAWICGKIRATGDRPERYFYGQLRDDTRVKLPDSSADSVLYQLDFTLLERFSARTSLRARGMAHRSGSRIFTHFDREKQGRYKYL